MTIGLPRAPAAPPEINPSNELVKTALGRGRISMAIPIQKLQVPEQKGYHLHWMKGDKGRLEQALRGGYEFVDHDEVELNREGLGNSGLDSGNEDMGSRVSIVSGADGVRLYLMKLKQEYWDSDVEALAERQEGIAAQLRGQTGYAEPGGDNRNRYSHGEQANALKPQARGNKPRNMFQPKE